MIFLKEFLRQDEGVTAIEYALIVALIATVIVAAVTTVGVKLKVPFSTIAASI